MPKKGKPLTTGRSETLRSKVTEAVDRHYHRAFDLNHAIHSRPELAFEEHYASSILKSAVEDAGFAVESHAAGLETAFVGYAGDGDLHIGICAEYDALPAVGHACGHNVIASSAYLASVALVDVLDDLGVSLRILGTPAEEGGGGKIIMLESGSFTGLHASMMIHPAPLESDRMPCVAAKHLNVTYRGKEAHASGFPQLGVNALDAMTIAQVSIGLVRQHIYSHDQVHGIITKGGDAPNVIPALVEGTFIIRSETLASLANLEPKILRCFEAGSVATGAFVEIDVPSPPYSEFITDEVLATLYRSHAEGLGRSFPSLDGQIRASTDMANISLELPTIHPLVGIDSLPAVNHQPEFTKAAGSASADRAMREGALSMALTIIDLALDQDLRTRLLSHSCR